MAQPESRTSKFPSPERIAIIGGGIASVCLIHELTRQNPDINIDLYCKDNTIASGASGNRQGAVYPLLQGSTNAFSRLHNDAFHFALDFYQSVSITDPAGQFQSTGVLQQAMTEDLTSRYQQIAAHWPNTADYISAERSSNLAGIPLPFPSLWFKRGGWIAPYAFCQQLIKQLAKQTNLTVFTQTNITTLHQRPVVARKSNSDTSSAAVTWAVETTQGLVKQDYHGVVVCAGFESGQFVQSETIPIDAIRGQVSQLNVDTSLSLNQLKTVISHKGYITPSQGDYQCFGATFDRNDTDCDIRTVDVDTNIKQIKSAYPNSHWASELNAAQVVDNRACIRANTADRLPIVGEVFPNTWVLNNVDKNNGQLKRKDKLKLSSELTTDADGYQINPYKGLYTLTGLGARGLTTAPLMAHHLAHQLLGRVSPLPPEVIQAISPMRFQIRQLKRHKDTIESQWS